MKNLIVMLAILISIPTTGLAGNVKPSKVTELFYWLNKNLSYPSEAIDNKEQGVVYIAFTISENGLAENVTIKAGVSETLNNEAVKTVKRMPLEKLYNASEPAKEYILPVKFSIK